MSGPSGKSLRLSFKGDKPKKRKRSGEKYSNGESSSSSQKRKAGRDVTSDVDEVGGDEQAWVAVESELDLTGPCFIFRKALRELTAPFHCVAFQPSLQSVEAATILPGSDAITTDEYRVTLLASDPKLAEELEDAEIVPSAESSGIDTATITPQSVYQVWVATKVPGSSSPAHFTFKSAEGKFLGADKIGSLQASMTARGPQEEWTLERSLDASGQVKWSLRSVHNRYLALDQVAGGKTAVRADSDSAQDETAQWALRVQWKHRHAARHSAQSTGSYRSKANDPTVVALDARDQVLVQELETFRSRAGSQYLPSDYASSLSKEERRALRKAQKKGRLAEEMLDRRSKMKRYAQREKDVQH